MWPVSPEGRLFFCPAAERTGVRVFIGIWAASLGSILGGWSITSLERRAILSFPIRVMGAFPGKFSRPGSFAVFSETIVLPESSFLSVVLSRIMAFLRRFALVCRRGTVSKRTPGLERTTCVIRGRVFRRACLSGRARRRCSRILFGPVGSCHKLTDLFWCYQAVLPWLKTGQIQVSKGNTGQFQDEVV